MRLLTTRRREHKYHPRNTEDQCDPSLPSKDISRDKKMKNMIKRLVTTMVRKNKTTARPTTMKMEKDWITAEMKTKKKWLKTKVTVRRNMGKKTQANTDNNSTLNQTF